MKDYWYSQVKETVTYSYCRILADTMKSSGDVEVVIALNKIVEKSLKEFSNQSTMSHMINHLVQSNKT